jgi:hypothetical protein
MRALCGLWVMNAGGAELQGFCNLAMDFGSLLSEKVMAFLIQMFAFFI